MTNKGLAQNHITTVEKYLSITGTNQEKITAIKKLFTESEIGKVGIKELEYVLENTSNINLAVDFTLARGLNYYTGIIFEAKAPATVNMGSIGGGGRYDDLTGLFGVSGIPGVGISFGIDRIYDVLEELNLFPESITNTAKAIFFNLGEAEAIAALQLATILRDNNISCELYPEKIKIDKQFKYADKKQIPYAIIIGEKEMQNKTCMIKDLKKGIQEEIAMADLTKHFTSK